MDRRDFLKFCAAFSAAGLASHFCPEVLRAAEKNRKQAPAARAKSVIEIWVWGGPCQLETFDPKPDAGHDINGDHKDIPTNVPGIRLSEYLPMLAKHADKFSIIRSMTHPHNGHETATYLMQTGRMPGSGKVYPAIGAVLAMFKSEEYKGDLPPYVILTVPKGRFSEVGFLDERYSPLVTGGNPNGWKFLVDGIVPPGGLSDIEIAHRFELLDKVDNFGRGVVGNAGLNAFDKAGREARRII